MDSSYVPNTTNGSSAMSRAAKFEEEKGRIIESCFAKRDEDGSISESYITHIRIVEDSAYPSTPPPPNSNPELKKPRLIIVAVRKTGRVRMHKARENANGTFSIGKTWTLDDLTAVESFTGVEPTSTDEAQRKAWGGPSGFIVTLGKPYFWQANTAKEKQFFIASLVKIYTKYTNGKSPVLVGFDAREREQLSGVANAWARPGSQHSNATATSSTSQVRDPLPRRDAAQEPSASYYSDRNASQPTQMPSSAATSSITTQSTRSTSHNMPRPRRDDSGSASINSAISSRHQDDESLRKLAGSNRSQDTFGSARTEDVVAPRSRNGIDNLSANNLPMRAHDRSITPISTRTMTPEPTHSPPPNNAATQAYASLPPLAPPERRRPPMTSATSQPTHPDNDLIPAPLASPSMRSEPMVIPMRSPDRALSRNKRPDVVVGQDHSSAIRSDDITDGSEIKSVSSSVKGTISPDPAELLSPTSTSEHEEEVRPGLGPMIKKKSKTDIANSFLKAAKTVNAFKPRAGGAAERMREALAKTSSGPDGITGVVPAPRTASSNTNVSSTSIASDTPTPPSTAMRSPPRKNNENLPDVKITVPKPERPSSIAGPDKDANQSKDIRREARRPKLASEVMQRELASIGLDPGFLNGRGNELVQAWEDLGWVGDGVKTKDINRFKDDIDRQLDRAQAQGWLKAFEEQDEKVNVLNQLFDKCIEECEELEGLLTLYSVELGTLTDDIAYIEAQSQGLQVQAANQKLLQSELTSLLETISISPEQLQSLREASLENSRGLESIEQSLILLFKAMLTIDPSMGMVEPKQSLDGNAQSERADGFGNSELSNMRVLQEKKDVYRNESTHFLRRLRPFLQVKFGAAIDETRKALELERSNNLNRPPGKAKLDVKHHDCAHDMLWKYSPLMLFAREVNSTEWTELVKNYEVVCKPLYQNEFRDAVYLWKRIARKPSGEESEVLFTSQIEKQTEGIATTARKLTVKRSQTLAKSLRPDSKGTDKNGDGRMAPYEVFGGALEDMVPIMTLEQNFMVEFFHIKSIGQKDFADAVAAAPPDARRGGDLRRAKMMDPNKDLLRVIFQSMEEIFSFFASDTQALIDWTMQSDPLQGVGVLAAIERKLRDLEDSNQEYLTRTLTIFHTRLLGQFNKFLDEQIRAVEDTKVKIKRRKGVISFFRIFPIFSMTLEAMLVAADGLDVREMVNIAYQRINKAMFEAIKVIARENPGAQTASADPEDKEALNYQILLIENMNHYLEEVDTRNNHVLEDWKHNATTEMTEHVNIYLGSVLRRPLGKILDFLESTESLISTRQPGDPATKIANMPSHSKMTFKKILSSYDAKEIRRGIETLKKRIEKHFGDADDPALSRNLVIKVLAECERYYNKVEDRILTIGRDVYDGDVMAEWTKSDVQVAFRGGRA